MKATPAIYRDEYGRHFAGRMLVIVGLAVCVLTGCTEDDVGRCCTVIDGADAAKIPVPEETDNGIQNAIRRDPDFECDFLTCVAYQGSAAYCTRDCVDDDDCPDGFDCRTVLQSDPGPGSDIQEDDRFCVREAHVCSE